MTFCSLNIYIFLFFYIIKYVPPFTNIKDNLPTLGTEEVLFATCTAAGSKPPAEVRWLTDALGDKVRTTTNSTQYDNDTTTTVSSLFGVPKREINGQQVQCVISGDSLSTDESLPFTIQIYLQMFRLKINCQQLKASDTTPSAQTSLNLFVKLDNNFILDGAKLQLLSLTPDLNGLYQCEASNAYGSKRGQLYVILLFPANLHSSSKISTLPPLHTSKPSQSL
uniref:Ig-like domain-containing protein n=1 Tax=Neolamprologus brichardi TaxID=32507 RepID=A0A3Q4GJD0_NEOBR